MPLTRSNSNPRRLLQNELERRCKKNKKYSLRAFARTLGISHALLSLVLCGKRSISNRTAPKIAIALGLDPTDRKIFLEKCTSKKSKKLKIKTIISEYEDITLDLFSVISDWHHYAILSLLDLPHSTLDPRWVAKQLNITRIEARLAIDRLKKCKMIQKIQGRWRQSNHRFKVDNSISTTATKKHHKQLLTKALESLQNDPSETRKFSAVTMAINPKYIPYAEERLKCFRRDLMHELETKGTPKVVYTLAMQLFPLSKVSKDKEEKRQ